jgi:hypothetical protein
MNAPTRPPKRPLARRAQARTFRAINVPMRALLALPFPTPLSRRLMLLHLTGRKTGRRYRQPVSYIRDGDTLLTPGGGRWKLNLVEGRPVRIRLRGRDIQAVPEIVSDPDQVQRLLELMASRSPTVKRFVAVPQDPAGHFDSERLKAAIDYGFRIIRWHAETTPKQSGR